MMAVVMLMNGDGGSVGRSSGGRGSVLVDHKSWTINSGPEGVILVFERVMMVVMSMLMVMSVGVNNGVDCGGDVCVDGVC